MTTAARWQRRHSALAAALWLALLAPAQAHAPSTGLGPAADGAAWLLEAPTDLLIAAALALLLHQQPPQSPSRGWLPNLPWPLAWTSGALLAQAVLPELWVAPLLSTVTLATALLVVLSLRLPPPWLLSLQLATGLGFGMVSGSQLGGHAGASLVLLGAGISLLLWLTVFRAALMVLRGSWGAIAVRVGGSWIAAAALLMLGWQLRHPP